MKKKLVSALNLISKNIDLSQTEISVIESIRDKVELILEKEEKSKITKNELAGHKYDYIVYSDGACRGNPGPGSYGLYIESNLDTPFEQSQAYERTTNNKMELLGIIEGLKYCKNQNAHKILVVTDSKYAINGMESWVKGWKARGWKKADKKTPENLELWKELDELKDNFSVLEFQWVKGHSGHPQNERCDELANKALDEAGH